jgi:hypothetical protein
MGYYPDDPPRHSHRTPAELAEDEKLASMHGDYCGPIAPTDADANDADTNYEGACLAPRRHALVRDADRPRIRSTP